MESRKQAIMAALDAFVAQRPGLEFGNYGDVKAYRSEMRGITKDRHHYNTLAAAVRWRDGITADVILKASESAYSGRLTIREREWYQFKPEECPGRPCSTDCDHRQFRGYAVDYCTGQYFPTEYRRAACAVLASALWGYTRKHVMQTATNRVCVKDSDPQTYYQPGTNRPVSAGDWLRAYFRKEFGRTIANRWFQ